VSEVYSYARDSSLNGLVPEKSYRNCAIVSFNYLIICVRSADLQICRARVRVETSTRGYLQIGCHMNTLFRRQVVSYLGSGVLFSTKGPSEWIFIYAHLKWT
jgi:hypothetical protein